MSEPRKFEVVIRIGFEDTFEQGQALRNEVVAALHPVAESHELPGFTSSVVEFGRGVGEPE